MVSFRQSDQLGFIKTYSLNYEASVNKYVIKIPVSMELIHISEL